MFHHDYQSALIKRGLSRVCTDIKGLIYRCQVLACMDSGSFQNFTSDSKNISFF